MPPLLYACALAANKARVRVERAANVIDGSVNLRLDSLRKRGAVAAQRSVFDLSSSIAPLAL